MTERKKGPLGAALAAWRERERSALLMLYVYNVGKYWSSVFDLLVSGLR